MNRLQRIVKSNVGTFIEMAIIGAGQGIMHTWITNDISASQLQLVEEATPHMGEDELQLILRFDVELLMCIMSIRNSVTQLLPTQIGTFNNVVFLFSSLLKVLGEATTEDTDKTGMCLNAFLIADRIELQITHLSSFFPARRTSTVTRLLQTMDTILEFSREICSDVRGVVALSSWV